MPMSSVSTAQQHWRHAAHAPYKRTHTACHKSHRVLLRHSSTGALQVTKTVNWNGATPDPGQTFQICITGPSYPAGDCKTVGSSGGTLTWTISFRQLYVTETDQAANGRSWCRVRRPMSSRAKLPMRALPTSGRRSRVRSSCRRWSISRAWTSAKSLPVHLHRRRQREHHARPADRRRNLPPGQYTSTR